VWIRTHNKIGKTLFENAAKLRRIRNQNYSYEGVGLYLNRPFGLQGVEAPRISGQLAHEGGKDVSPTH